MLIRFYYHNIKLLKTKRWKKHLSIKLVLCNFAVPNQLVFSVIRLTMIIKNKLPK